MNRYKVVITFNDGNQIQARVEAEDQGKAMERLTKNEQVVEFVSEHGEVKSIDITYIGESAETNEIEGRYLLTPSQERAGYWVAVDKHTGLVMMF